MAASPDGTRVPQDASAIVDSQGAVWIFKGQAFGPGTFCILKDGWQFEYGWGTGMLWKGGNLYCVRSNNDWFLQLPSGWQSVPDPSGTPSPPTPTPITKQVTLVEDGVTFTGTVTQQ
jgi:hypothetical protein